MPLFRSVENTVVQVWRRTGDSAGGDAARRLVHRDLGAFFAPADRQRRSFEGRVVYVTGLLLLPDRDAAGVQVDVMAGDLLKFTDYRGELREAEAVQVRAVHALGYLDHIEVEVA